MSGHKSGHKIGQGPWNFNTWVQDRLTPMYQNFMDIVHELCPAQLLEVTKKSDNLSAWLTSIQHLAHIWSDAMGYGIDALMHCCIWTNQAVEAVRAVRDNWAVSCPRPARASHHGPTLGRPQPRHFAVSRVFSLNSMARQPHNSAVLDDVFTGLIES